MKNFADNVVHFNREIVGIPDREKGLLNHDELTFMKKVMTEERDEFVKAHADHDYIGAIDALIDQMYFCIGGLHKLGLSVPEMEACCQAVHEANMTKKGGQKKGRETGTAKDAIKPEGWVSPEERIAAIVGGYRSYVTDGEITAKEGGNGKESKVPFDQPFTI